MASGACLGRACFWMTAILLPACSFGPAMAQILPPCCQTPDILIEIASRPANESVSDFIEWLDDRERRIGAEGWKGDVAALYGACAKGCPPRYAIALNELTQQISPGVRGELRSAAFREPSAPPTRTPVASRSRNTKSAEYAINFAFSGR